MTVAPSLGAEVVGITPRSEAYADQSRTGGRRLLLARETSAAAPGRPASAQGAHLAVRGTPAWWFGRPGRLQVADPFLRALIKTMLPRSFGLRRSASATSGVSGAAALKPTRPP